MESRSSSPVSIPMVSINMWYHAGSGSERPGRTGFAHLFEHLMFEGSKHVPEGAFDNWLEAAGGSVKAAFLIGMGAGSAEAAARLLEGTGQKLWPALSMLQEGSDSSRHNGT